MIHNAIPLPEPWEADVHAADSERKGCCGVGGRRERLKEVLSLNHENWVSFI